MAGWNDAPHLGDAEKARMLDSIPPYQRDARSKGIPMLGAGAIFPIGEEEITCKPFDIPKHWPRAYGMDVGWNWTAVVWGALDKEGDTLYLYNEMKRGKAEPDVHAGVIKSRGIWIPGAIDPASNSSNQKDGTKLFQEYRDLGLDVHKADNSVEAGLLKLFQRMTTGRLVVFNSLVAWFGEFRTYHRDEDGKIVKTNDHLMDATRYLAMTGLNFAMSEAEAKAMYTRTKSKHQPGDVRMGY